MQSGWRRSARRLDTALRVDCYDQKTIGIEQFLDCIRSRLGVFCFTVEQVPDSFQRRRWYRAFERAVCRKEVTAVLPEWFPVAVCVRRRG